MKSSIARHTYNAGVRRRSQRWAEKFNAFAKIKKHVILLINCLIDAKKFIKKPLQFLNYNFTIFLSSMTIFFFESFAASIRLASRRECTENESGFWDWLKVENCFPPPHLIVFTPTVKNNFSFKKNCSSSFSVYYILYTTQKIYTNTKTQHSKHKLERGEGDCEWISRSSSQQPPRGDFFKV